MPHSFKFITISGCQFDYLYISEYLELIMKWIGIFFAMIYFFQQSPYKQVGIDKFRSLIEANHVLIDVRTYEEYKEGHIEGAINIDVKDSSFIDNLSELDKNKTYLIYCRSGKRSQKAGSIMMKNDFEEIYDLKGGYLGWTKANN